MIRTWLSDLDECERGIDGYNFAQYAAVLDQHGYRRLHQLADESHSEEAILRFSNICEMPIGVMKLILKYARKDCERIKRNEMKKRLGK